MIEAKYFKDYKHNYLILKCEEAGMGENYQHCMLASHKIDKILKCSVRNINGAVYLYYDISSKVTLENLYQGKKMSYEQVKDFFEQMDMIYRNLEQFFMDESGLMIEPNCIYYDFTSKQYYGLYYPRKNTWTDNSQIENLQTENPYESLMDFLLNHVDTANQKLVDSIYQIYEMSQAQFFSLANVLPLFENMEEETITSGKIENIIEGHLKREEILQPEGNNVLEKRNEYEKDSGTDYRKNFDKADESLFSLEMFSPEMEDNIEKKIEKQTKVNQRKTSIFYGVFTILSLCGIGSTCWIYQAYELTQQELMIIICCSVVMGLCFLFSLVQFLLSGRRSRRKEHEERELKREIEDEFPEEKQIALHKILDNNMDLAVVGNHPVAEEQKLGNWQQKNEKMRQQIWNQDVWEEDYGETVFINRKQQNIEYKLYAMDKKNKRHIELTAFPFTIGKMPGCVDCVLMDDSISRLHARIEKKEGKIFLTDMNSTNGTYKNGLRMEPSETVEIEPGDEIRFGKLNYCYR